MALRKFNKENSKSEYRNPKQYQMTKILNKETKH